MWLELKCDRTMYKIVVRIEIFENNVFRLAGKRESKLQNA